MNTCRSGVREAATTQETEEKKNVAAEHPEDVEMEHEEPSDAEGATRKVEGDQEAAEARRRNTAMRLKKVKRKGNTERGVGGRGTAGSRAAEKGRKVEVGHVDRDAKPRTRTSTCSAHHDASARDEVAVPSVGAGFNAGGLRSSIRRSACIDSLRW